MQFSIGIHIKKIKMKKLINIIVLLGFILPIQAKYKVTGVIKDDNNKPIPFVTVQFFSTDSLLINGVITDEQGTFLIPDVDSGKYLVSFSCVGYATLYKGISILNKDCYLSDIVLTADNIILGEVVVKGTTFIRKKDHTLIIPDKQQLKHAYSGYDVLYNLMIPGVDVDPRSKSVSTSRGAVTLYINGVQADLREVQNLRPKDIEKVEYYDIPSGIYTGDIASINYITKEYKVGGYVTLDAEQNIGYTKGDYNIGAKIAHGNTNYTFFGGYNMAEHDGVQNQKNELLFFPDYQVNLNSATLL